MTSIVKDKKFYLSALAITLPIAGQSVINIAVNMIDTVMIGSFGESQISACALANQFYFIFVIICMGIGFGTVVLASQFWGRNDVESISKAISLMIKITVFASLIFTVLTYLFPGQIMRIFTNEPEIIEYGIKYLKFIGAIYFFHGTALTMTLVLRSVHSVKIGLITSIAAFFINVFFNWLFIFGNLGAPRMELAGAALGTLISRVCEFAITFFYVFFIDKKISFKIKYIFKKIDKVIWKDFLSLGSPVIISDLMLAFGNSALAMIMGRMGSLMVAANSIVSVVVQISTILVMGVSNASAVKIGNTVGAGQRERAQQEGFTFLLISIILGLIGSVIMLIISPHVIGFYNISPETVNIANQLMLSMAINSVFMSVSGVMTKGVLRGGGDTRFLMVADVLFLWIASVLLGYLSGLVWGLSPFWVSNFLKIDMLIKSVWCIFRFASKKWIKEV